MGNKGSLYNLTLAGAPRPWQLLSIKEVQLLKVTKLKKTDSKHFLKFFEISIFLLIYYVSVIEPNSCIIVNLTHGLNCWKVFWLTSADLSYLHLNTFPYTALQYTILHYTTHRLHCTELIALTVDCTPVDCINCSPESGLDPRFSLRSIKELKPPHLDKGPLPTGALKLIWLVRTQP